MCFLHGRGHQKGQSTPELMLTEILEKAYRALWLLFQLYLAAIPTAQLREIHAKAFMTTSGQKTVD